MEQWFKNILKDHIQLHKDYYKLIYITWLYEYLYDYYNNSIYPVKVIFDYNLETLSKQLKLINLVKNKEIILIEIKSHQIDLYDHKGISLDTLSLTLDEEIFRIKLVNYIKTELNTIKSNI